MLMTVISKITLESIPSLTKLCLLVIETGGVANHGIRLSWDPVYTMIE